MKFDPRQPHGTITGHQWARYEQNGQLYDANGNRPMLEIPDAVKLEPDEDTDKPEEATPENEHQMDFRRMHAKDFLLNILKDGPLPRAVVYQEADNNNQDWNKVNTAFADLGGEKFKRGVSIYWKLKTE